MTEEEYQEKERMIADDLASISNRVRHAYYQGYELGRKSVKENAKLKENIEWLIEQYQHEVETIEQDLHDNGRASIGNSYKTGKVGVYGKVIADLKEVLDENTT